MIRADPSGIPLWSRSPRLLLASFGATAQRVEGDRAGAQGMYAAEVPVNGQGEARAQWRLCARRWRRCWPS